MEELKRNLEREEKMKITDKQRKILEDNFNIYNDEDNLMELESWTDGGVDMIIHIDTNNDLVEELENYINNFNINIAYEYVNKKDFKDYIEFVKGVIK